MTTGKTDTTADAATRTAARTPAEPRSAKASAWRRGICGICPAGCWVEVRREEGKLVDIRPDTTHTLGMICRRGEHAPEIVHSEHRLLHPLRRVGPRGSGEFERVSWDQAYQQIVDSLRRIEKEHGPEAVGMYTGRGAFELSRINDSTTQMMESMNDIVWAIKADNDQMVHVINRMRAYSSELMEAGTWEIKIEHDPELEDINLSMVQRRDVYLIFKEAVNNAVKYSGGDQINIELRTQARWIILRIQDNGQGFDPKTIKDDSQNLGGNGLINMERRAHELGGELHLNSAHRQGTTITLRFNPKFEPKIH